MVSSLAAAAVIFRHRGSRYRRPPALIPMLHKSGKAATISARGPWAGGECQGIGHAERRAPPLKAVEVGPIRTLNPSLTHRPAPARPFRPPRRTFLLEGIYRLNRAGKGFPSTWGNAGEIRETGNHPRCGHGGGRQHRDRVEGAERHRAHRRRDARPRQARRARARLPAQRARPRPDRKRSFTVGLLTNDTYGRFTLPVMAGICRGADRPRRLGLPLRHRGRSRALGQVHVDAMLDKQVDGIIATRQAHRPPAAGRPRPPAGPGRLRLHRGHRPTP